MKHLDDFHIFESKSYDQIFPSEDFGKDTGMDWIYKDWKLPVDANKAGEMIDKWSDDLDVKAKAKKAGEELIAFYQYLIHANPELKDLGEPKSWLNILDFCYGVISKFIIDDIKFYANLDWPDKVKYNMGKKELMNKIEKKTKSSIGWVMSPTTIERVKKELDIK